MQDLIATAFPNYLEPADRQSKASVSASLRGGNDGGPLHDERDRCSRWKPRQDHPVVRGMKKRYHGPWFGNDAERARFEFNARARRLPFRRRLTREGVEYAVPIVLGHCEDRAATIRFGVEAPTFVSVEVDGPTESKHRYPDGHLCMWHPDDPEMNRWGCSETGWAPSSTTSRCTSIEKHIGGKPASGWAPKRHTARRSQREPGS